MNTFGDKWITLHSFDTNDLVLLFDNLVGLKIVQDAIWNCGKSKICSFTYWLCNAGLVAQLLGICIFLICEIGFVRFGRYKVHQRVPGSQQLLNRS